MSLIRVCFFGTPDFAAVCLESLLKDEHFEVVGVVSQPDKPAGRKLELKPSAVKLLAQKSGLRVMTPSKASAKESLEEIRALGAEVAVVVAYGQILSQALLDAFPFGAVNVHASLLPRWRGAAPIQRAIEAGDSRTGVCLQKMVKELDAGDVLGERVITISEELNALELHDQLAQKATELLHVELMDFVRGNLAPLPQDSKLVTYAKKISKEESRIDWSLSAQQIHNKIRAFLLGPGTFSLLQQNRQQKLSAQKLKFHRTRVLSEDPAGPFAGLPAGEVVGVCGHSFTVKTGAGLLEVLEVQPESKAKMKVIDFLRGNPMEVGESFKSSEIVS